MALAPFILSCTCRSTAFTNTAAKKTFRSGHHGSLTSSRTAFLDAVGAKIFVTSSGP